MMMTMTAMVMTTKTTMGEMAGIYTLIGRRPPKIHRSETTLPRPYRALLSQLRSGHSVHPQSYFHWIGKATSPLCPLSDYFDDSVSHLFGCPAFRMSLIPDDFWRRPVLVAEFLSTHPSFSSLPPLLPPPPPPFPLDSPLFSPLSLPSSISSSSPTSSNSNSQLRGVNSSISSFSFEEASDGYHNNNNNIFITSPFLPFIISFVLAFPTVERKGLDHPILHRLRTVGLL